MNPEVSQLGRDGWCCFQRIGAGFGWKANSIKLFPCCGVGGEYSSGWNMPLCPESLFRNPQPISSALPFISGSPSEQRKQTWDQLCREGTMEQVEQVQIVNSYK